MAQENAVVKGLILPVLVSTMAIVAFATFARTRMSAQYGAGRRRVYWERQGGLIPEEEGISQLDRRRERGAGLSCI